MEAGVIAGGGRRGGGVYMCQQINAEVPVVATAFTAHCWYPCHALLSPRRSAASCWRVPLWSGGWWTAGTAVRSTPPAAKHFVEGIDKSTPPFRDTRQPLDCEIWLAQNRKSVNLRRNCWEQKCRWCSKIRSTFLGVVCLLLPWLRESKVWDWHSNYFY